MIRLLLVEHQPTLRWGLRMRLKLEADVEVIGEPADGLAALAQTAVLHPDVVLVDIEPLDMDSVRLIRAMRIASPQSAIVILSLRDDPVTRRRMSNAGAAAFVSKHEFGDRLLQAIREVAIGSTPSLHALPAEASSMKAGLAE